MRREMELQEVFFNDADKQVSINQDEYIKKKNHYLKNRLPFELSIIKKGGEAANIIVAVAREENTIIVHLLSDEMVIGRLYLAKPDIFPGAYYVSSVALLPAYQGHGVGMMLYDNLMRHMGISFVGIDQSMGARKMWVRLSRGHGNSLFVVMPTRQHGNVFFHCKAEGVSDYSYLNYDKTKKFLSDGGNQFVILTKTTGKLATYIKQHMKLTQMRHTLSKTKSIADPFAPHIGDIFDDH